MTTFLNRIVSFLDNVVPRTNLGNIWEGNEASKAYQQDTLHSKGGGRPVRIAFRNLSSVPLLLCWVSENGDLNHFYKLQPSSGMAECSKTMVAEGDHIEHAHGGHAFCLAYVPEDQIAETRRLKSLQGTSSIIGGYRPFPECGHDQVHLITVFRDLVPKPGCCGLFGRRNLRKRKTPSDVETGDNDCDDDRDRDWFLRALLSQIPKDPWDTTKKVYELKTMGGWPVHAEPNWHNGDTHLEAQLAEDLREVAQILPSHAVEYLRQNCPIWLNNRIKYGPKVCPVTGRGCCYHPCKEWLIENGLSESKHKCVEINDGPGYKKDLHLWGAGGIMVHELSHAYHHRMILDGYDNKEILACYNAAMKEGLYDCVKVHGSQGPKTKAYACSNDKEYFAELSTAFLGGKDGKTEFNKWYPFNRQQLKEHDPRAYKLLCRVWKIAHQST